MKQKGELEYMYLSHVQGGTGVVIEQLTTDTDTGALLFAISAPCNRFTSRPRLLNNGFMRVDDFNFVKDDET